MTWRVCVIHLSRRTDRQPYVEALRQAVPGLGVYEGIEGVPAYPWTGSAGAWGNREAHQGLLERALEDRIDRLLVFEDDAAAVPLAAITELVSRLPKDWEALMLGGEHIESPIRIDHSLVRCKSTIRTHAYLLTREGIGTALAAAERATMWWDHTLAKALGDRQRTYAPSPFLVKVIPSPSDIPDSVTPMAIPNGIPE